VTEPPQDDGRENAASVRRVPLNDERVAGIRALSESLGYTVFDVDLAGCHDKAGLLERMAGALSFPNWFGHNWDAWFDCLTDLGWHPAARGYVLVLRRALRMQQAAPEALDTALAIIEDAARVWSDRGVTLRAFVDAEAAD
jgi:Barstar (barnase inhibitor)